MIKRAFLLTNIIAKIWRRTRSGEDTTDKIILEEKNIFFNIHLFII